MNYVAIVTVVALLQFQLFGYLVGRARTRYGIAAPAVSGNEMFERHFRAHANTLEQLVIFMPSLWILAWLGQPSWAAGLGVVFIIGRAIYFRAYVRDPKGRGPGFALTAIPSAVMMLGILWIAIGRILISP
jgi:glutathione S-transferase